MEKLYHRASFNRNGGEIGLVQTCSQKLPLRARTTLTREAAKRPTTSLEELKTSMAKVGESINSALYSTLLWRDGRKKGITEKKQS